MRRPERIPIIVEALKNNFNKTKVLEKFFKPKEGSQLEIGMPYFEIDTIVEKWDKLFERFSTFWTENPDLRLSQILITGGILENYPGDWYYLEDEEVVVSTNILEPRDVYFWGQNFDKNLNKLPETKWTLIKDMSTEHIEACLDFFVAGKYLDYFKNELKIRKNDKK